MSLRSFVRLVLATALAACGSVVPSQPDGGATDVTLTVTRSGDGTGTVTSSPAGLDCGTTCTLTVPAGTVVTLTATPESDSELAGWTGGGCTGTDTCELTLDADVTVDARFYLAQLTVTVSRSGAGSGSVVSAPAGIDCGGDCTEVYPAGTSVTLTATAMAGSMFVGWSGGACTGTGTCMVATTASVTATFALAHQLSVTMNGNGKGTVKSFPAGIDCGTDCAELYEQGTEVTLTATPAAGSYFAGWSGACTGTGACKLDMTAARVVAATFQPRGVLYTIRQNDNMLRRLDPDTLQYMDIGPLGVDYEFGDCAWDTAANVLYMVTWNTPNLYRVNTSTGAATAVGVHQLAQLRALAFHPPSGQLYAVGADKHLFRINPSTAAATSVGATGVVLDGMAWDSKRNRMVGIDANLGGATLYTISLVTGAATQLAPAGSIDNSGLAYDPVIDRHWAVDFGGQLLEYNPNANMTRTTRGMQQGMQTCITYRP